MVKDATDGKDDKEKYSNNIIMVEADELESGGISEENDNPAGQSRKHFPSKFINLFLEFVLAKLGKIKNFSPSKKNKKVMLEHFWILVLDLDLAMVAFLKKGASRKTTLNQSWSPLDVAVGTKHMLYY